MVALRSPSMFSANPLRCGTLFLVLALAHGGACAIGTEERIDAGVDAGRPVDAASEVCGSDVNAVIVQGTTVSVTGRCLIRDDASAGFFNAFESAFFFGDLIVTKGGDVDLATVRSVRGLLRFGDEVTAAILPTLETVGGVVVLGRGLRRLEAVSLRSAFGIDFVGHPLPMTIDLPAATEIDVVSGFNSNVVAVQMPSLLTVRAVEIVASPNLEVLDLRALRTVEDRLLVRENPMLNDCLLPANFDGRETATLENNGDGGDACGP